MSRVRALLVAGLLVGAGLALAPREARAGWAQLPVTGTPTDLVAVDSGVLVYSSSGVGGEAAAWVVTPDGGLAPIMAPLAGNFVGGGLIGGTCLVGLASTRNLVYGASCGTTGTLPGTTGTRFRVGVTGIGYGVTYQAPNAAVSTSATPAVGASYTAIGSFSGNTTPATTHLTTVAAGGSDYLLVDGLSGTPIYRFTNGAAQTALSLGVNVTSLCGYVSSGVPHVFAVTGLGTLLDVGDFRTTTTPIMTNATFPSQLKPAQVAFTLLGGDTSGAGFGLLSTADGGVGSPIPDPSAPGASWIARGGAPPLTGYVTCFDSSFCAAVSGTSVFAYFNEAPPFVALPPVSLLDGTSIDLTADAGDFDGDPIFIAWSSDGGVTLTTDGGEQRGLHLVAPAGLATCSTTSFSLLATVSDGYAPHTNTVAIPVTVTRTGVVTAPIVTPSAPTVAPGSAPLAFSGSTSGGCPPSTWSWSSSTAQVGTAQSFNWTVPALSCTPDGGTEWVELTASDAVSSAGPTRVNIRLLPTASLVSPSVSPASATAAPGSAPLIFTASSSGGCPPSTWTWTSSEGGSGAGTSFAWTPPALSCTADGGTSWVQVVASDGTRTSPAVRANIAVGPTTTMPPPTVSPSAPTIAAGSGPVLFTATAGAGCPPTSFSWTASDSTTGSGTTFSFTPPALVCTADAGAAWVDVQDSDGTRTSVKVRTPITITPNPTIATPVIAPAAPTVTAGGPPITFTSSASGGCPATSWAWAGSDGTGGSSPSFAWTPPSGSCDPDGGTVTIQLVASNGLASSAPAQVAVRVLPNDQLPMPTVTFTVSDAGYLFSASTPGSSCQPTAYSWVTSDGYDGGGPTFAWAPRAHYCTADAGEVTISVRGSSAISTSAPNVTTVPLDPWGAPEAPIFDGGTQPAGSTVEWFAGGPPHFCAGTTGFPGTEIVWRALDAGGPGVDLIPIDGGLRIASLDACASRVVTGTAVRAVAGAASPPSAPGELVVHVVAEVSPITSPDQLSFSASVSADGGVYGSFTVDAGCLASRGLEAFVSVDGGGSGCSGPVSLGAWALPKCELSCESRTYDVTASLSEDGGSPVAKTVSIPLRGATESVASVSATPFALTCGQPSEGELSVTLSGQCNVPTLSWSSSVPGAMTLTGPLSARFVTGATGYELLGQRVTVTAIPDNGTPSRATELVFTTTPFLAMTTRFTQLPAREEEATVVTVDVANGTPCGVTGVDVKLDLAGLVPVTGSLTVDGAPHAFTAQNGQLVVSGLDVAAKSSHQLRFKAHVVMLSRTRAEPHASVGAVEVGFVPEQPTGCGCNATPGPEWLSVVALIAWVRSRRRAC